MEFGLNFNLNPKSALYPLAALFFSLAALGSGARAYAAESQQNVYTPAYFSAYSPRTALDMVSRIPGFTLQGGDGNDSRGLGQGGANVLINGSRISGKSNSASDALSRITVDAVVQIKIVDGASLNIPGLTGQVADVTTKGGALTGTWEWTPETRKTSQPLLEKGSVSIGGSRGKFDYTAALTLDAGRGGSFGPETLTDEDGILFEQADEISSRQRQSPEVSIGLTYKQDEQRTANLSASYKKSNFNGYEISRRQAVPSTSNLVGVSEEVLFERFEDETSGELSGDYEFPIGPGTLKLIGLRAFENSPMGAQSQSTQALVRVDGARFLTDAKEDETIGRAEYSLSTNAGHTWQGSLEGAFNVLEIENELFLLDSNDQFLIEDVSMARVEEKRSEISLTHGRNLTEKLDIQLSVGAEYSQLIQSGEGAQIRDFLRPKGFLFATYSYDDSLDFRFEADRRVGQLSFFDFISSEDLQNSNGNAGNANLVPQQFWNLALQMDKEFGQGNTLKLRLFYEDISDIVDRVPVGIDGDAVGNIDLAIAYGVILESTIKGEKWGLPGTELDIRFGVQQSKLEDPITGLNRRISRRNRSFFRVEYRHDIDGTDWAYGAGIEHGSNAPQYRVDEIFRSYKTEPFSNVFIEHKDVLGIKLRATVLNLLDTSFIEQREVFTARRDTGVFSFDQNRARDFGPFLRFSFSGTF